MSEFFSDKILTGWGGVCQSACRAARPEREAEVMSAFRENAVNGREILAAGNFRSYGDSCLNSGGDVLVMNRLDRFLSFQADTGELTAEAGVTLSQILHVFLKRGFVPPVSPGTGFCTLGGALANDVHGKNHESSGCFSRYVTRFSLLKADGEIQEVTRESDLPLFCATAGGLGLTGIILNLTLKLKPVPGAGVAVHRKRINGLADFLKAFDDNKQEYSVGWVDAAAAGGSLGRGVLETGEHVAAAAPNFKPEHSAEFPFHLPAFALNRHSVKIFNELYFRRIPQAGKRSVEEYRKFVYPLDKILNWNRMYGKKGFYQFQCVIPVEKAEAAFSEILADCAKHGNASFLAVIKKTGPESEGMLSFPKSGYTLALDFPARGERSVAFLKRYEEITQKYDGRIYFAKDAVASKQSARAGYPRLNEFLEVLDRVDPNGKFSSDAARRLGIEPQNIDLPQHSESET